jgi:sugar-phosphatase
MIGPFTQPRDAARAAACRKSDADPSEPAGGMQPLTFCDTTFSQTSHSTMRSKNSAMSAVNKSYAALLFDMDGTLLNSIAAAERVWGAWAARHGLDKDRFLPTIHGVRAADTISRQNLEGIDIDAEVEWIMQGELGDVEGVVAIEGIAAMLASLPPERWAIVTSATVELATRRLDAAGIARPPLMISAEDVSRGKPNPDCFLLAAEKLGVTPGDCLVFEDAPAGIQAAEAAGCDVMVITATHQHRMETPHRTIPHYGDIVIELGDDGRLHVVTTTR